MRVTSKRIGSEIERVTGIKGVAVSVRGGQAHFYSDTNKELQERLSSKYSTAVFVCRLNHLTLTQWVSEFESILEGD